MNEDKAEIARVKFEEVQKMQKEVKDKHRSKMYKLEKRRGYLMLWMSVIGI